jgi:hypothetical protein
LRARPTGLLAPEALGKLERGAAVVTLFPQAEGRAFNVVIPNAPISHNRCIAWKLREKKTALALDPGIFVVQRIPILAHDPAS